MTLSNDRSETTQRGSANCLLVEVHQRNRWTRLTDPLYRCISLDVVELKTDCTHPAVAAKGSAHRHLPLHSDSISYLS